MKRTSFKKVSAPLVQSSKVRPLRRVTPRETFDVKTFAALSQCERNALPVSAVEENGGVVHTVSALGDVIWDLRPLSKVHNRKTNQKIAVWPTNVSADLLHDAQSAVYLWMTVGIPGWQPASAHTVIEVVKGTSKFLSYISRLGVSRFDQLKPIHVADFAVNIGALAPTTKRKYFQVVELVRLYEVAMRFPLGICPWQGTFSSFVQRHRETVTSGKTFVIPPSVQTALFLTAESIINGATVRLDQHENDKNSSEWGTGLRDIRDAVMYLLQISTGMRNSEATAVKTGSWWREEKNGTDFYWVSTIEFKTGRGRVDFLASAELHGALEILARWARPYHLRLQSEAQAIRIFLGSSDQNDSVTGTSRVDSVIRLREIESLEGNLFLTTDNHNRCGSGSLSRVTGMSGAACNYALRRLAKRAGVEWDPTSHQCRRTFAFTIAQSKLGRHGLIFLKWQLKHRSMSMTELYAANPRQDQDLFEEIEKELLDAKSSILEGWYDSSAALAGAAGKAILKFRAIAIKGRSELLRLTASHVTIRSNGHAWCLAEGRGCGGEGMYDAARCASGCSSAVIDQSFQSFWLEIHRQNEELLQLNDCGPGVEKRVRRILNASQGVLNDLGVSLKSEIV